MQSADTSRSVGFICINLFQKNIVLFSLVVTDEEAGSRLELNR